MLSSSKRFGPWGPFKEPPMTARGTMRTGVLALAGACLLTVAGCGGGDNLQINGAGATFPAPIYEKWFSEYNRLHPTIQINYQPVGSGGGINQLSSQVVFFGATDGPMNEEQSQGAPGTVLHFPTVLGGVVPIYNLSAVNADLRFTGQVLADIYLGKITRWNDPALTSLNPDAGLPDTNIAVVHRSEGSGTTYIWCDYLSKVSPEYGQTVGVATSVQWPVGLGARGNDGVTGLVRQTPGSIGYVELIYAQQNNIPFGSVQNAAGQYVHASLESVTAAAAGAAQDMPEDFRVSITNAPGETAYPISSFTWLLLYQNPDDKARAQAMNDFLRWALTDGQAYASELGYAPLPAEVVQREMAQLETIALQ
jgi:phosphate transport system substrate-binding protein